MGLFSYSSSSKGKPLFGNGVLIANSVTLLIEGSHKGRETAAPSWCVVRKQNAFCRRSRVTKGGYEDGSERAAEGHRR